jgi:ELWxxDGT repeat protein
VDAGVLLGHEGLSITDGTPAGTRLVRAFAAESFDLDVQSSLRVGPLLFFPVWSPATGRELWRSDGTTSGTFLLADLYPGREGSNPSPLGALDGVLLFAASDGVRGQELWASDGTVAGTRLVRDINPGPGSSVCSGGPQGGAARLAGHLFFCADDGVHGPELWASDGTTAGTQLVAELVAGAAGGQPYDLETAGDQLFFSGADPVHGRELWASDGSTAGTRLIVDLIVGAQPSSPSIMGVLGSRLVFGAVRSAGSYASAPYVTDGTASGTFRLADVWADVYDEQGAYRTPEFAGHLVFVALDWVHGWEPWTTDGTVAGTMLLGDFVAGPDGSQTLGEAGVGRGPDGLYFCARDETWTSRLWRTGGTPAGTTLVAAVDECDRLTESTVINDALLFDLCWTESCGPHHDCDYCALWKTDGTAAGTRHFWGDPIEVSSSAPRGLTARDGGLIFGAHPDPPVQSGESFVYGSDGSAEGTFALTTADGGRVDFGAYAAPLADGEVVLGGATSLISNSVLVRTDGARLTPVLDSATGQPVASPDRLTRAGDLVFFSAFDAAAGEEPWRTDGTAAGTLRLRDIWWREASSSPHDFADGGGRAWFDATNWAYGGELWESDGTSAGTRVHDLTPGPLPASTSPWAIRLLDPATGLLTFFSGSDLYSFEPSASSAVFLRSVSDAAAGDNEGALAVVGTRLFFMDMGQTGSCEVWFTDGTPAGTTRIGEVGWSTTSWNPQRCGLRLVAHGGRLFFTACDAAHGCELWTSDGSANGTRILADVEPGPVSFVPEHLASIGDRLYFSGCTTAHGCEPWATDGSAAGLHRLADIAPGIASSFSSQFTLSGRLVYFVSDDTTGEELWAMPLEIFYDGFESGDPSRW